MQVKKRGSQIIYFFVLYLPLFFLLNFVLFLGTFFIFLASWLLKIFGSNLTLDQVIFHLFNNDGVDKELFVTIMSGGYSSVLLPTIVVFVLGIVLQVLPKLLLLDCLQPLFYFSLFRVVCAFFCIVKRYLYLLAIIVFIYGIISITNSIAGMNTFFNFIVNKDSYQQYIVKNEQISFQEKRNLVFIMLESMEATFQDTNIFENNLMLNLTAYQNKNAHFSFFPQIVGTTYTMGALVAYFCAEPMSFYEWNLKSDGIKYNCLPDILHSAGYNFAFMQGSSEFFAGLNIFANQHHFGDKLIGLNKIKKKDSEWGKYDSHIGWGISDFRLYQHAKEKLLKLSKNEKPFAFVLNTIDTHFPNGFLDPICEKKYGDFRDVVVCADSQVADFITWIKEQDFAKDTLILIVNDHLFMGGDIALRFLNDNQEKRLNYNVFINPILPLKNLNRQISHYDFLPTILEAIGADVPRLGLGVSLYRDEPTLLEKLGKKNFSSLLFYRTSNGMSFRRFIDKMAD